MYKKNKKKLVFFLFLINCATYQQPGTEAVNQEINEPSQFNKKMTDFSASVLEYSKILDPEINYYRNIVRNHCDIEGANKVGEMDFPFYEKKIIDNNEGNSYFCRWNFRKEIIQFSIQDKQSGQVQVDTLWYENLPSSIRVFYPDKNIYITRGWQWSVFHRVWEPTFVYLEFDLKRENRRLEYYFSRYTGSIIQKKEFIIAGKEDISDGWFYNYDGSIEEEHCHLFKNGNIISRDKNLCEFPLF
jgi:hypothetical protein